MGQLNNRWNEFREQCLPADIEEEHAAQLREIFFSGAGAVQFILAEAMRQGFAVMGHTFGECATDIGEAMHAAHGEGCTCGDALKEAHPLQDGTRTEFNVSLMSYEDRAKLAQIVKAFVEEHGNLDAVGATRN